MRERNPKCLSTQEKEQKQERRRTQNRINKRNQRLRDKIKGGIPSSLSKEQKNEEYIKNLISHFDEYEFDIHFTGTFEPKYTKKISLQSLKSYTDKFIQLLIDENIIEYGLIFLDTGETDNNHTHIVIKSNQNIKNIKSLLISKWLLGNNINVKDIETKVHKLNTIKYNFGKMGKSNKNKGREIKMELWNFIKK